MLFKYKYIDSRGKEKIIMQQESKEMGKDCRIWVMSRDFTLEEGKSIVRQTDEKYNKNRNKMKEKDKERGGRE
jgi:hypothetical protein